MNRTALVTGGSRGIGFGIALCLAAEKYDLAICGLREEGSTAASLERLRSAGGRVEYFQSDLGRPDAGRELISQIRRRFERLDLLVNNAGMAPPQRRDLLEATEESFELVLRVNLQGPYFLIQAASLWMIEQRKQSPEFTGCVINITSISATVASINRGEYCISKAGMAMASSLWAVRLAEFGIRVFEVRPGVIRTDMTAGVTEKYDRLIEGGILLQPRWGNPEDVGKAVAMLARGDLPYSTGQVIMVDGGFSVARL